jgi:predicted transcriptional regulator
MATMSDLLESQREAARIAKRDAEFSCEDSKADPTNRLLRIAADDATRQAAEAGRKVTEIEFTIAIDDWFTQMRLSTNCY